MKDHPITSERGTGVELSWTDRSDGRVAWVEVSEPTRLNILNTPALEDLARILDELGGIGIEGGLRAAVLNLFDAAYAYNFGNPFSGTHFGAPRTASVGLRIETR